MGRKKFSVKHYKKRRDESPTFKDWENEHKLGIPPRTSAEIKADNERKRREEKKLKDIETNIKRIIEKVNSY